MEPAKIYIEEQRGCSELPWLKCFHTFNFGQYYEESRQPFGTLVVFNDTTLAAEHRLSMCVDADTDLLLIPLVGGLEYKSEKNNELIALGQACLCTLPKGTTYELINPYPEGMINFLEIWLLSSVLNKNETYDFNLNQKNQLISIGETAHIGQFDGRAESVYSLKNKANGIFVFVIAGAFEVQNRLMHARDGLALWNTAVIEFEALSNEAIILCLEIPMERAL